jgi:hypothetical protein
MTCKFCGYVVDKFETLSSTTYQCFRCGYIHKLDYSNGIATVFEQKGKLSNRFTGRKRRKYLLHSGK